MFTVPDKGEGQNDLQSIFFQEYLEALVAGINGLDCVLSGGAVTAQGSPDMTVAVAKAAVLSNGVLKPVTAGNVTIGAADSANPRLDLIVADSSGAKQCRAGTAAVNPKPPARTANDVLLAVVYVPAADTTIATAQIIDMRVMRTQGPITLYKTVAAETTNTTAAAIHILNKAASGVVIPSGLFLSGKTLRVRIYGNFLINSGTPSFALAILYGGTTMFSDASVVGAVDADRGAWFVEFNITAQGNADQALGGMITFSPVIAQRVAATTGIGEMALNATSANNPQTTPFSGSAAVDSDAADRTLAATITINVSNVANELVVEGATVELV